MKIIITTVLAAVFLTACGGEGGSSKSTPPPVASSSTSSVISSSSSSTASISPLPEGSGTFVIGTPNGEVIKVDEEEGYLEYLPNPLPKTYFALELDEDGYVYGSSIYSNNGAYTIDKIDLLSGEIEEMFELPERITSFTITPESTIVAYSDELDFRKRYLYEFSMDGEVIREIEVERPFVLGYSADGDLLGFAGQQVMDITLEDASYTDTGITLINNHISPSSFGSDVDIDNNNQLRISGGDELIIHNLNTGYVNKRTVLQTDFSTGNAAIVHR